MRNRYRILVGKSEGMRPLGRSIHGWEDTIKMDLTTNGICGTLVNVVTNLSIRYKGEIGSVACEH